MAKLSSEHIIVVGAGAAGLMAARELGLAGRRVTILESRDRFGGRICPLPKVDFGYAAEGGAEFVHGESPVTRRLTREAGLTILALQDNSLTMSDGRWTPSEDDPYREELHKALRDLAEDMPVAEFLRRNFGSPLYAGLRRSIAHMVEGYDAADPEQASTLALRDEWMLGEPQTSGRLEGGYGTLINHLAASCHKHSVAIFLNSQVCAVERVNGRNHVRCTNGRVHEADVVILTVPLPLIERIRLPPAQRRKAKAAADIGFGNVIKIVLRFTTPWWDQTINVRDLTFLLSDAKIPVWWTQNAASSAVLTGWLAGRKTEGLAGLSEKELLNVGLESLAQLFSVDVAHLKQQLIAGRAINWAHDPHSCGAYSYAMPRTRNAQAILTRPDESGIIFSGEALYRGRNMGTVEAALASGEATANVLLGT